MYTTIKIIFSGLMVGFMVYCFTLTGSPPAQTVKNGSGTVSASPEDITNQKQPASQQPKQEMQKQQQPVQKHPQQLAQAQRPHQIMPADRPAQTQRSLQNGRSQPGQPAQPRQPVQAQKTTRVQATKQPQQTPATNPSVRGLTADEQKMLGLVNSERAKHGLAPLAISQKLAGVARLKAGDMVRNNYFSHTSPTYGSPFDMIRQSGISYHTAGENLAGASTVHLAHANLMNSSGHRANILSSSFKWVGIGIVDGGPYGKMFVQMFTG